MIKPLILLVCLGISACLFRLNCARLFIVHGSSMSPTYHDEQKVVGYPINGFTILSRGDIVVAREDGELIVKRIIGLPGETVLLNAGQVFIDGHQLIEPYLPHSVTTGAQVLRGPVIRAGHNQYIVMGDNRPGSSDSREFGALNFQELMAVIRQEPVPARLGKDEIAEYDRLTNQIPYLTLMTVAHQYYKTHPAHAKLPK
jgi:signal peptidase I